MQSLGLGAEQDQKVTSPVLLSVRGPAAGASPGHASSSIATAVLSSCL